MGKYADTYISEFSIWRPTGTDRKYLMSTVWLKNHGYCLQLTSYNFQMADEDERSLLLRDIETWGVSDQVKFDDESRQLFDDLGISIEHTIQSA
jgi:hypothetical protein